MGRSFAELNQQLNKVIEAFKAAREEKEVNIHFLNTLVQHVDVGIICYDATGSLEILNNAAIRLLGIYRIRQIEDLKNTEHHLLYKEIVSLPSGGRILYHSPDGLQLAVNTTKVSLRGKAVKIVSLQNIRSELQEKEVEAWQNLTKVLRHEIMNSIAPIVSLVGTMRNIVDEDLDTNQKEAVKDLSEALLTIENRGKGVMNFVNAYRDFTTLPKPIFQEFSVTTIFKRIEKLELSPSPTFEIEKDFTISCDIDQIEMVLLNLIKNATQAINHRESGEIKIRATHVNNRKLITVSDNGEGIVPEALEKIFIPFYTTKKDGQGIGLSLSKQIMQMHKGDLKVQSEIDIGTVFTMEF